MEINTNSCFQALTFSPVGNLQLLVRWLEKKQCCFNMVLMAICLDRKYEIPLNKQKAKV